MLAAWLLCLSWFEELPFGTMIGARVWPRLTEIRSPCSGNPMQTSASQQTRRLDATATRGRTADFTPSAYVPQLRLFGPLAGHLQNRFADRNRLASTGRPTRRLGATTASGTSAAKSSASTPYDRYASAWVWDWFSPRPLALGQLSAELESPAHWAVYFSAPSIFSHGGSFLPFPRQ